MRSQECYFPALVRELIRKADESDGLGWLVNAALAMNEDTEWDLPSGPDWEHSVGWAASQCLKTSLVLGLDKLPGQAVPIIHHVLLQLDLNRTIQVAEWSDPKRAFELAAKSGYYIAVTTLREGKGAKPIHLGVLPELLSRATVLDPLKQVIANGECACQLVLGIHRFQPKLKAEERAILLSSVPLFGRNRRHCREWMWQVLAAPETTVGLPAKVVALVKLASWFALADVGEITAADKRQLLGVRIDNSDLQRLSAIVPQFVKDEVLSA